MRSPAPSQPRSTVCLAEEKIDRNCDQLFLQRGNRTKYAYDGAKRRTIQKTYSSGVLSETRHLFYTITWQVIEERVGSSSAAERQFVWGLRYIDDLVLRDRDTNGDDSLDERLYAMQDANWNVTGVTNASGTVQERYVYAAYGTPTFFDASFNTRGSSSYQWETLYAGYRWNSNSGIWLVRFRCLHGILGCWMQRDPFRFDPVTLYLYVLAQPGRLTDPLGLEIITAITFGMTVGSACRGAGHCCIAWWAAKKCNACLQKIADMVDKQMKIYQANDDFLGAQNFAKNFKSDDVCGDICECAGKEFRIGLVWIITGVIFKFSIKFKPACIKPPPGK